MIFIAYLLSAILIFVYMLSLCLSGARLGAVSAFAYLLHEKFGVEYAEEPKGTTKIFIQYMKRYLDREFDEASPLIEALNNHVINPPPD